VKNN